MRLNSGKLVVAVLILIAFALVAYMRRNARGYDWQRFDSPDGNFTVSLPGKPLLVDAPTNSGTGGSFISHRVTTRASAQAAYGCSWWEDPSLRGLSTEDLLSHVQYWGLYGVQGELIQQTRTTVQGHPAVDEVGSGRGGLAYDDRIIVVGGRVYALTVVDTSGRHDTKNIEMFFHSFSLR